MNDVAAIIGYTILWAVVVIIGVPTIVAMVREAIQFWPMWFRKFREIRAAHKKTE